MCGHTKILKKDAISIDQLKKSFNNFWFAHFLIEKIGHKKAFLSNCTVAHSVHTLPEFSAKVLLSCWYFFYRTGKVRMRQEKKQTEKYPDI